MTSTTPDRHLAGAPASKGGRFRESVRAESASGLDTDENREWGAVDVHEGSRTPWGNATWVEHLAPGIAFVSTEGHGGVKLSPERRKGIPAPLRVATTWWEEDCERSIVGMYFPEAFGERMTRKGREENVRRHYPDQWERATGGTVQPGESPKRDRETFDSRHTNDFIERQRVLVDPQETHDGALLRVTARQESTGRTEDFLVPLGEARSLRFDADVTERGQDNRIIVDAHRHQVATPLAPPVLTPTARHSNIVEPATPGARAQLQKDLAKSWRRDDGTVETLRDIVGRGVTAKNVQVENGVRKYSLHEKEFDSDSAYSVIPVSRATFDAVQAPNARTARNMLWDNARILEHRLETATHLRDKLDLRTKVIAAREAAQANEDRLRTQDQPS